MFMSMRAIFKSNEVRKFAGWLGALYIRIVHATGNWQVIGGEAALEFWKKGKPFILVFWHGRLLMMPYSWRHGQRIHLLISQHRDGQMLAHFVKPYGFETITGSTSKGGAAALRKLVKVLREGDCVGITPDGPRGPRMRVSEGIISLARLTGVPILPATYSVARGKVLGSWDRFLLAAPFSRGVIIWGSPVYVNRDSGSESLEKLRQELEKQMNKITLEADESVGRQPVLPAPLTSDTPPV